MPDAEKIRVKKKKRVVYTQKERREARDKERREKRDKRREEERKALELRQGGATYEQIAQTLGLPHRQYAKNRVDAILNRYTVEAAKSVVKLDLQRLDEYTMRLTHALRQNGDLNQIDRLLRVMEFRYRLLGINGEDVRALQEEHGIHVTNNSNTVMVVQASPESEDEFIKKMMLSVGINADSEEAKNYMKMHRTGNDGVKKLPMLEGSANDSKYIEGSERLDDDEIVDAEIVGELD